MTSVEFNDIVRSDLARWGKIIREVGVRTD
jgi:tripartite-type tricarboxylate transporter receptor subunit TctC